MNLRQIWEETSKKLEKVYVRREAESIASILLADLFQIEKSDILLGVERTLNYAKLDHALARLLQHEPIQYVTGVTEFYGRKFHLATGALIPRPETEELVSLILSKNSTHLPKMLDIGTGSGCIAISLALETGGETYATDFSRKALSIAGQNARKLKAEVSFLAHDVLQEALPIRDLDIVVSNPPYIPESERNVMHSNVLDYEPNSALFVPDDDPLLFYHAIGKKARTNLKMGGLLFFEVHENYGPNVRDVLIELDYKSVEIHQDMQGKDRMVIARWK